MEETRCANPNCVKHREKRGGRFKYDSASGKFFCEDCIVYRASGNPGRNLWDFETTHFTGDRVHVRGLKHLDELCRTHGVSNHAREHMERNW